AVQVRHRQHRQHPSDRLECGGLSGPGGHLPGVAEAVDTRPKKKPAVIKTCAAAYVHQIGTASASVPSTNRPIPIIASDQAKHTAPTAVHRVGSCATSAADTIATSTTM